MRRGGRTGAVLTACSLVRTVACNPGLIAANPGSLSCTNCPTGAAARAQSSAATLTRATGTYANASSSSRCASCVAGTAQGAEGAACAVRWTNSRSHRRCPAGQSSCLDCGAGYFSDQSGAIACASCPVGRKSGANAIVCDGCPAGEALRASRLLLTIVHPGSYQSSASSSDCLVCEAGRFVATGGARLPPATRPHVRARRLGDLLRLPRGTRRGRQLYLLHGLHAGHVRVPRPQRPLHGLPRVRVAMPACRPPCSLVSAEPRCSGFYSAAAEASVCDAAPVGTFVPNASASSPSPCSAGQFQDQASACAAAVTQPTHWALQTGASRCKSCGAGSFSGNQGASFCDSWCARFVFRVCADRSVQPRRHVRQRHGFHGMHGTPCCVVWPCQHSACRAQPCDPGRFSSLSGQTVCSPCGLGTFASGSRSIQCQVRRSGPFPSPAPWPTHAVQSCSAGTAAGVAGSSQCGKCTPGNFQGLEGQSTCSSCTLGFAVSTDGQPACSLCPDGFYAK